LQVGLFSDVHKQSKTGMPSALDHSSFRSVGSLFHAILLLLIIRFSDRISIKKQFVCVIAAWQQRQLTVCLAFRRSLD